MTKLQKSLLMGFVAGIIDIIPMIAQRLDIYSIFSAFSEWIILGILINYFPLKIKGFLKGLLISEIVIIPVLILVSQTSLIAIIPIIIMTAILGSTLGLLSNRNK